jgi:transposase
MRKAQSSSELGFTDRDIARLSKAMQQVADKRTFIRLWTVWLVAQGHPISQVARLTNKSFQIIYQWIATYLTHHQPVDLHDAPKTGRPLSAQPITDERILRALQRNPWKSGFQTQVWTVATLALYLNKLYNCSISSRTPYRRMKQMGLECKRPRYVYEQKDPNRTQKKGQLSES